MPQRPGAKTSVNRKVDEKQLSGTDTIEFHIGETGELWDTGNSGTKAILRRSYNLISTRITWNIVIVELHLRQKFHH